LQWVSTQELFFNRSPPWRPILLFISMSSACIFIASSTSFCFRSVTVAPAFPSTTPFIRSIAQKRFTAVGLVEASSFDIAPNSFLNTFISFVLTFDAPRATPMAAETPMAGAPLTTMSLMALATSLWFL